MLEVALIPIISKLISINGIELRSSLVWKEIIQHIEGTYDNERQPNDYHTADFGTVYRTTITNLICDKFGAERKHTKKGSVLMFDLDKFTKTCKSYGLDKSKYDLDIQTQLKSDDSLSYMPSPPSPPSPSSIEYPPKCYHCNIYGFGSKDNYETHGVRMHKGMPLYPGKADLDKHNLIPQNMPWEAEIEPLEFKLKEPEQ